LFFQVEENNRVTGFALVLYENKVTEEVVVLFPEATSFQEQWVLPISSGKLLSMDEAKNKLNFIYSFPDIYGFFIASLEKLKIA
jgi:hypothetical protein